MEYSSRRNSKDKSQILHIFKFLSRQNHATFKFVNYAKLAYAKLRRLLYQIYTVIQIANGNLYKPKSGALSNTSSLNQALTQYRAETSPGENRAL